MEDFVRKIKNMDFLVKLDTNGYRPQVIQNLLEKNLLDYVAMDIKHSWEKYESLVGRVPDIGAYAESVEIIKKMAPDYEFRSTIIGGIHDLEDFEKMSQAQKVIFGNDIVREMSWIQIFRDFLPLKKVFCKCKESPKNTCKIAKFDSK